MRRISLAVALLGAIAGSGCGVSGKPSSSGSSKGVPGATFTVTIRGEKATWDPTALATVFLPEGGRVTGPGGLSCGIVGGVASFDCEADFPWGSTPVSLNPAPDAANGFTVWAYAGSCTGRASCAVSGNSDRMVLVRFAQGSAGLKGHENWSDPRLHGPALADGFFKCRDCHGATLQGFGLAFGCGACHDAADVTSFNAFISAPPLPAGAKAEQCRTCHAGEGAAHQAIYNRYADTSKLVAAIESVASVARGTTPETYTVTLTFSLTKDGAPYAADVTKFGQKTVYVTKYDPATRKFDPTTQLTSFTSLGGGRYTAKNTSDQPLRIAHFAPESSNAIAYAYFAENPTLIPPEGHYKLYDDVASIGRTFGTIDYVSAANNAQCENCHGAPYQKHGYRAGPVSGLPDLVACKACHYDTREGTDQIFQMLADDPLAVTQFLYEENGDPIYTPEQLVKYEYVATVVNDTHMSHAMEFAYPQSMANCVTCHAGKLGMILTDANFTLETCKGCHPVKGVGGTDPKRAPALNDIMAVGVSGYDHGFDPDALYTFAGSCNGCHNATGAASFSEIHAGRNAQIYAADGSKYSDSIAASIGAVTFDSGTNVLTIPFTVSGVGPAALVKPTVVVSLYGYDTKDFIVGGHGSTGGLRNLEWTEGAGNNSPRLTVAPLATPGNTSWTAIANLSTWASKLADGSVKKAEISILPVLGLDPDVAVSTVNPAIAIAGASKTFDLVGAGGLSDAPLIVSAAKCNKCHDALGTTFHSPSYGSAGVVACRVCHVPGSGASHLPMQSRSIDSYVHAIHSFQPFDPGDIDFTDPVENLHYEHHIGSTYPNFTILNCESCHVAASYEVPANDHALPAILSANDPGMPFTVPSVVTGPASKACGGCHRAVLINEGDVAGLDAFDEHTKGYGYRETNGTGVWDDAILDVFETP